MQVGRIAGHLRVPSCCMENHPSEKHYDARSARFARLLLTTPTGPDPSMHLLNAPNRGSIAHCNEEFNLHLFSG